MQNIADPPYTISTYSITLSTYKLICYTGCLHKISIHYIVSSIVHALASNCLLILVHSYIYVVTLTNICTVYDNIFCHVEVNM